MKIMIVGSRSLTNQKILIKAIMSFRSEFDYQDIDHVITGGAKGIDTLAEKWAKSTGRKITVIKPDWDKHGRSAGVIRTREMFGACDGAIIIWDGKSKGTKATIDMIGDFDVPVFISVRRIHLLMLPEELEK